MVREHQPFSLGVIGGGLNSAVGYAHFVASQMDNRWIFSTGCFSKDLTQNNETAQKYNIDSNRVYSNWKQLISNESGKINAILILTPTPVHGEMIGACFDKNIPVICEKSLSTSFKEAQHIATRCKKEKQFLSVIYNYTGYPMIRELRHRIQSGDFGKIIHFQAEMPQEGFIRTDLNGKLPHPQAWRLQDGVIPTIYLDLGSHLHQMIYYLTGANPISVIADHDSFGHFKKIVDNVECLCRYSNGMQGHFWFSKSALGYRNGLRIRIYGEKCSAEWYQLAPETITLNYVNGRREILDRGGDACIAQSNRYTRFKAGHPAGFIEAMANFYCDIADELELFLQGKPSDFQKLFGVDIACDGLEILDAIAQSVQMKKWRQINRKVE